MPIAPLAADSESVRDRIARQDSEAIRRIRKQCRICHGDTQATEKDRIAWTYNETCSECEEGEIQEWEMWCKESGEC